MTPLTVLALAALEEQSRRDFPDSVHLAPVLNGPLHHCANRAGRKVTLSECVGLGCRANRAQFKRCLDCEQGKRLAATSPFRPRPKPVYAPTLRPEIPAEDPRLDDLAASLRQLTADGRVRVSLLDLMTSLGLRQYDDAMRLVRLAGLTHGRPFGSVPAIAVDHSLREFLSRAEVPHAQA